MSQSGDRERAHVERNRDLPHDTAQYMRKHGRSSTRRAMRFSVHQTQNEPRGPACSAPGEHRSAVRHHGEAGVGCCSQS